MTETVDVRPASEAAGEATAGAEGGAGARSASWSLRGSALLLFGRFLAVGSNLLIQVLVVRYLSQEAYGAFAYAIGVVNFLTVCVSLGMEQAVQRFAAVWDERRQPERLAGALLLHVGTVMTLGTVVVGGVLVSQHWLGHHVIHDQRAVLMLCVLVTLAPLQALDTLVMNLFAVYARPSAIFFRRYILSPALKVAVALAVVLGGGSVFALAWGYVGATLVGLVVYANVLVKTLSARGVIQRGRRIDVPFREVMTFTLGAVTADLVVILLFASDVVIVGHFGGSRDVALLQAVQPLANGNLMIFYAIIPLFIPQAARLFARRDRPPIARLYSRCTLWIAVFTFPVLALTASFAGPVTTALFGRRYESAAPVLALLSVGQYILALFGLTTLTLKAMARLRLLAWANISVGILNIVINVLLVPRFGPVGAAAGTMSALIVLTVLKGLVMHRELGVAAVDREILGVSFG